MKFFYQGIVLVAALLILPNLVIAPRKKIPNDCYGHLIKLTWPSSCHVRANLRVLCQPLCDEVLRKIINCKLRSFKCVEGDEGESNVCECVFCPLRQPSNAPWLGPFFYLSKENPFIRPKGYVGLH
ncbi:hypothetical protein KSP40_PGU002392 [Platanthera guangdongensis]|uniref:Uncharacterized protein n=1 Tax=Platanthera guangdongensis TaxID=2320717 RepID=A0ABR2MG46_9ASPA